LTSLYNLLLLLIIAQGTQISLGILLDYGVICTLLDLQLLLLVHLLIDIGRAILLTRTRRLIQYRVLSWLLLHSRCYVILRGQLLCH